MKEASLVFVRTPDPASSSHEDAGEHLPVLQLQEGTRIEARLETQISTDLHAPVVAVVENMYAVGDTVLVPAGARIFGKLSQADTQGNVGVDLRRLIFSTDRERRLRPSARAPIWGRSKGTSTASATGAIF
jgi:Bacterial conjugation TrbI-like protein